MTATATLEKPKTEPQIIVLTRENLQPKLDQCEREFLTSLTQYYDISLTDRNWRNETYYKSLSELRRDIREAILKKADNKIVEEINCYLEKVQRLKAEVYQAKKAFDSMYDEYQEKRNDLKQKKEELKSVKSILVEEFIQDNLTEEQKETHNELLRLKRLAKEKKQRERERKNCIKVFCRGAISAAFDGVEEEYLKKANSEAKYAIKQTKSVIETNKWQIEALEHSLISVFRDELIEEIFPKQRQQ